MSAPETESAALADGWGVDFEDESTDENTTEDVVFKGEGEEEDETPLQ
jgi:hypothetical protein